MKQKPDTDTDLNRTLGGSDSLLRPCLSLLTRRDFTACRDSATRLPRSDPDVALQLDQIIAVAEVLAAATPRHDHRLDWYSILRLPPNGASAAERDTVRRQFKTLVRLLDPNKNTFPFAAEALMRVREAWSVLSDPERKARFDREIQGATASFWTMCPYCWFLHEYESRYEDCTLRCANCRKTFHGASVVAGKDEYYCYHVSLPMRYPVGERCRLGDDGSAGRKRLRVKTVANRVKMKVFVDANGDLDSASD
ncbi:uncharacterized protein LOC109818378 [Cajanus cajan]|uniref:uncharacterized protein LOC109818378 n=1 Tax=Cajanus cajan TaxID=3821 RepID=UPI00098D7FA1|nr:uncharacterized protein LOC109818378 [Cajanus cajan]